MRYFLEVNTVRVENISFESAILLITVAISIKLE